jgi:hypothetical protein
MTSDVGAPGLRPMRQIDAQAYVGTESRHWYRDGWLWWVVGATAVSGLVWALLDVYLSYSILVASVVLLAAGVRDGERVTRVRLAGAFTCAAVLVFAGTAVLAPIGIGLVPANRITQGLWGLLGAAGAFGVLAMRSRCAASRNKQNSGTAEPRSERSSSGA